MPRTIIEEKTAFKFDELDESAQERALDYFRQFACEEPFWFDFIYDDCATIFDILGIDSRKPVKLINGKTRYEPEIYFSGFWNQGDGACFVGNYSYRKGSAKAIRAHAPQDSELHRIADGLAELQRKSFYSLSARLTHTDWYHHSHSVTIDVEDSRRSYGDCDSDVADSVAELLRDLMDWIYKQLESEYEYQTSDDCLRENIDANGYEFDESGRLI